LAQAASEPTVQATRASGAGSGFSRGRGRGRGSGQRNVSQAPAQARVYALTREEALAAPEVIAGKVSFITSDTSAFALIDPGSSHSFISTHLSSQTHREPKHLGYKLSVHTPLGKIERVEHVYPECEIIIGGKVLPADLILLPFHDFDIILGMDWLARHRAKVDCYAKEVVLVPPGQSEVIFCGERQAVPECLISAITAFSLIQKGCEAYLAHVVDTREQNGTVEGIPVVREFPDVFPEELPGLPPDREVEMTIEVVPGTAPISVTPYRMAPLELEELKKQLQELLDKGFIKPSVSP
jgi:hypothetical protein